jgi:hypothetical protein
MKFSEWLDKKLKEDAGAAPAGVSAGTTTTAAIATFPRPAMFVARGDFFPRKHKKKV